MRMPKAIFFWDWIFVAGAIIFVLLVATSDRTLEVYPLLWKLGVVGFVFCVIGVFISYMLKRLDQKEGNK